MGVFANKEGNNSGGRMKSSSGTNQFVEGTVINGDIKSANDIRVDGTITGTIESSAKIAIGKNGKIDGDVLCDSADIEGKIIGTIQVKGVLILKSTAVIDGDIISGKLVVEQGAVFNGTCSMGVREGGMSKSTKQLQRGKEEATLRKEVV